MACLPVRIGLGLLAALPERFIDIRSPEQDAMSNKAANLKKQYL
jgi:hypothetical protein